jgi:hypothetical protein
MSGDMSGVKELLHTNQVLKFCETSTEMMSVTNARNNMEFIAIIILVIVLVMVIRGTKKLNTILLLLQEFQEERREKKRQEHSEAVLKGISDRQA